MYNMQCINDIWNNHRWTLFFCAAIIVFILFAIFDPDRKNTKYKYTGFGEGLTKVNVLKRPATYGTSKPEKICKEIAENYFKLPFTKTRPNFLKYKTGRNLELDMYCPVLNLAIEYNGRQHRQFTPYF